MKGIICVLSLLIVSTINAQQNGCPYPDPLNYTVHLPHPTDCHLFYRCDHGQPKLDECPSILHFNPVLEVCDWPANAGCTAGRPRCSPLLATNSSEWAPPTCSQEASELDATCSLTCVPGFELAGGDNITMRCTAEGWVGSNGLNQIPECVPAPGCARLPSVNSSQWTPQSCYQQNANVGDLCRLTCEPGFDISGGSEVRCTAGGWSGMNGLNQIPECKEISDLGGAFIDRINKTLHGKPANLLFLLDESGSVAPNQFDMEVQFMKAIVGAFPLASYRSAGAITFSSNANVDIRLNTADTCSFMNQADIITYSSGGTNILGALQLAINEIAATGTHNLTVVFLITDGESQTDPTSAADQLKANGVALFTVGIANYSPSQLIPLSSLDEAGVPIFFGIDSFEIFEKLAQYLETAYNNGEIDCSPAP